MRGHPPRTGPCLSWVCHAAGGRCSSSLGGVARGRVRAWRDGGFAVWSPHVCFVSQCVMRTGRGGGPSYSFGFVQPLLMGGPWFSLD